MNTHRMNRPVRWLLTNCLILTMMLTLAGPARAASYVVTNLNDSGKGSLRQAITDAVLSSAAGAVTITFRVSGTIVLLSTLPAINVHAGLTIDGTGQSITISGNDAVRLMWVNPGGVFTLRNITITGGKASASPAFPGWGGGVVNYGTLTVIDSTFSGNNASSDGGGIYNAATLDVSGSTFSGNYAINGGGIRNYFGTATVTASTFSANTSYAGSGISNVGTLTVTDSAFSGNSASAYAGGITSYGMLTVTGSTFSGNTASSAGGAIFNQSGGTLELSNSTFSQNSGTYGGGGIYNFGTLNVSDTTFSDNSTGVAGGGGGIFSGGPLNVTDSTFSGNSTYYFGGGGIFTDSATATVTNSTFSNNSAADSYAGGGGIYNNRTLNVINSTFSGNSATQGGGISNGSGMYNLGVTLRVANSTISGNSASLNGGGIYNHDSATLQNTLVANSTDVNCTDDGSLIDGGGNLSWPDTTCPGLNADPLLGPLQDNGGPTQTLALVPGSPAIDAALLENCPATDQRGISRPQGAACDIGAYEYESVVYNFSGFFQPVDNLPTWNVVQAGVGVPVRFSLGGDQGLNIFAAGYPMSPKIACGSGGTQDVIEETVLVGSSSLSYDAASDTYTYVWKTSKAWATTCRQLIIRLNDGSEHMANFKFVR